MSCLDIGAPTILDRNNFARAFAKFFDVPLINDARLFPSADTPTPPFKQTVITKDRSFSASRSAPRDVPAAQPPPSPAASAPYP